MIGRNLAHFRIDAKLGEGGMGVVYRATDQRLRREVALKVLPEALAADPERRRRFLREARAAAAVTHGNIATVYDIGEANGHVFIAMEFVRGRTLRERMKIGLAHVEALRIAQEIARGLAHAHESGIVHRDLKPENVMVTKDGEVKILDFGIAKLRACDPQDAPGDHNATAVQVTAEGQVMGTPAYMSPEQVEGRPAVDARSDVFSFGVMLYEMLAGKRPFDGETNLALMYAVVHQEPKPLDVARPDVTEFAAALVAKCLKKAPAERFASGREVLTALGGGTETPLAGASIAGVKAAERISTVTGMGTALGATLSPEPGSLRAHDSGVLGEKPRIRLRGAAYWLGGFGVLAGIAFVASFALRDGRGVTTQAASATPPLPAASASPAPAAVTRIIDLPPPPTTVPAAAAEYASGIQAVHDDNWISAIEHFEKAADLDPAMALAHLRLAIAKSVGNPVERRAEFAKAASLRAQLGQRDVDLMQAMQPFLQAATQDIPETDRRLQALADRYPNDAEIWMLRGFLLHPDDPANLSVAEHALLLDPEDAQSWETKGRSLLAAGNLVGARLAFERCGKLSVNGADCFAWIAMTDRAAGRCVEFEADAHRAADREAAYGKYVLRAMVSRDAPPDTIDETVNQLVPHLSRRAGPEFTRAALEAQLAIVAGNFDRASELVKREDALRQADPALEGIYSMHYNPLIQQISIATETASGGVGPIASQFVARSAAWARQAADGVDLSLYLSRLQYSQSQPPPPAFDARRSSWIDARVTAGISRAQIWHFAYAAPALTAVEARAALEARSQFGEDGNISRTALDGSPEAELGRVYLLAGDADGAISHLTHAVAQCDLFDAPIQHVRAALDLGRALEMKEDRVGACEAYGKVLAQWGNAKPRSATADAARARVKALGCKL